MMTSNCAVEYEKSTDKILTHEYSNAKALMFVVGYSDQH